MYLKLDLYTALRITVDTTDRTLFSFEFYNMLCLERICSEEKKKKMVPERTKEKYVVQINFNKTYRDRSITHVTAIIMYILRKQKKKFTHLILVVGLEFLFYFFQY